LFADEGTKSALEATSEKPGSMQKRTNISSCHLTLESLKMKEDPTETIPNRLLDGHQFYCG
jgi:hypothetical protein